MINQTLAIVLLREALQRIEYPSANHNDGDQQTGGAYWRLAKVLRFLDARMDTDEGEAHAATLRALHGRISNPVGAVTLTIEGPQGTGKEVIADHVRKRFAVAVIVRDAASPAE